MHGKMKFFRAHAQQFLVGNDSMSKVLIFTEQERNDAINAFKAGLTSLSPENALMLETLDEVAISNSFNRVKLSLSRVDVSKSSYEAGIAWFQVISLFPDSRVKQIIISEKVINFLRTSAMHLYKEIIENDKAEKKVSYFMCEEFLKIQFYFNSLSVMIGANNIESEKRSISHINTVMFKNFGSEATAMAFIKFYDSGFKNNFDPMVGEIFKDYALSAIKHDFYNAAMPSSKLVSFYRNCLSGKLDAAIKNSAKSEEDATREEIENMSSRELYFFERGCHELCPNISYAGKISDVESSTLRRRSKPNFI